SAPSGMPARMPSEAPDGVRARPAPAAAPVRPAGAPAADGERLPGRTEQQPAEQQPTTQHERVALATRRGDPTRRADPIRRTSAPGRFALRASGVAQGARLAGCAAAIAAAGALGCSGDWLVRPAVREARRRARRARAAQRLAATLGALKGPFAKAGQFA